MTTYEAVAAFGITDVTSTETIGHGHINQTSLINCGGDSYILQEINTKVFSKPDDLFANYNKIREAITAQAPEFEIPQYRTGPDRKPFLNIDGTYFRLYPLIIGRVRERPSNLNEARLSAGAFGKFLTIMNSSVAVSDFCTPIPNFHNLRKRFSEFDHARKHAAGVASNRYQQIYREIDLIEKYRPLVELAADLERSSESRICHSDTKFGNVVISPHREKVAGIIDLDTVMPGYLAYDFGDMVRSMCHTGREDESETGAIHFDLEAFHEISFGFTKEVLPMLTSAEKFHLIAAPQIIVYEQALRFLTDYLQGDQYYRTEDAHQNLRRSRVQLQLLAEIVEKKSLCEKSLKSLLFL